MSVSLRYLLESADVPEAAISGLSEDSRTVQPGDAFIAVRGDAMDGHDFIPQALGNGAAAVLCEHALSRGPGPVPEIVVNDLKTRRSALAGRFYGEPSRQMQCVGVTGTNGKTTIAHYIADLAGRLGRAAGYMGTIGWGVPGALEAARLTTEGALTVQERLRRLADGGCELVAMEVSSHALAQDRVAAVAFDVAVFSNLTRDHLDYHASEEAYAEVKARLFAFEAISTAVINLDDAFGQRIARGLRPGVELIGYGRGADISWNSLAYTTQGIRGRWVTPWGDADLELPVAGEFSVANMAAALGALVASGLDFESVVQAAAQVTAVPGRMEFFRTAGKPAMVVDFAHTPDALDKVLEALRRHTGGKLICVFGCGGDRDRGKRALMAAVAERRSDVLWMTSDNPRSEDPGRILDDMARGLSGSVCMHRCTDREQAISQAMQAASADDLILVAGKGHEDYQEIAGQRFHFSDREIVANLLGVIS